MGKRGSKIKQVQNYDYFEEVVHLESYKLFNIFELLLAAISITANHLSLSVSTNVILKRFSTVMSSFINPNTQ